ncbi:hypothetical protein ABIB99_008897 [Bradyrhizobium sp. LA6.1]|uniref:hypothetical protein n=1 Tax=Bradyrhizobium sp. LA6.1 TaxID=3156378 RepID=UPI0033942E08
MSHGAPRIEAQYLQAAAQTAASYYKAIWQKVGYVIAIQYGGIAGAYVFRSSWASILAMIGTFIFSVGIVWASQHEIRNRDVLIAQVNYLAQGLDALGNITRLHRLPPAMVCRARNPLPLCSFGLRDEGA